MKAALGAIVLTLQKVPYCYQLSSIQSSLAHQALGPELSKVSGLDLLRYKGVIPCILKDLSYMCFSCSCFGLVWF